LDPDREAHGVDGAAYDTFGNSVAISGNMVVVGACGAGAAYEFTKPGSGWANMTQNAKLTASDGALGTAVAVSGDTVIVGEQDATVGSNSYQGAAYVFTSIPLLVAPPSNQLSKVGQSKSFDLGSFASGPTAIAPFSIDVNWGDGSADTKFNQSAAGPITTQNHSYATTGNDTVTVTVTDSSNHSSSATLGVTVVTVDVFICGVGKDHQLRSDLQWCADAAEFWRVSIFDTGVMETAANTVSSAQQLRLVAQFRLSRWTRRIINSCSTGITTRRRRWMRIIPTAPIRCRLTL